MSTEPLGIPEVGLQLLQSDLQRLEHRLRDEKFARELYRALAGNRWEKDGEAVALSWKRAEEFVNALRKGHGQPPLQLFQTGGEGEVDSTVQGELEPLGWKFEPVDTSEPDPAHLDSPEDSPPRDHGERMRERRS
jgi:hypothetical protein